MKILLTNDDGIRVDAMKSLAEALSDRHDVWVVAPDGNRSGKSMSITLHDHLKVRELGNQWFSCSGSPTDCVWLVAHGALAEIPDMIISGINYGPNLGTDILYSGTAAAARQGTLSGIPSIAVSLNQMEGPWDFGPAVNFISENAPFLKGLWRPQYFLNINIPPKLNENYKLVNAFPCRREYRDDFHRVDPPRGSSYFFPHGYVECGNPQEGSDLHVVLNGDISITAVSVDPVRYTVDSDVKEQMDNWEGSHEQRDREKIIS